MDETPSLAASGELAKLLQLLNNWQQTPADVQALSTWLKTGSPTLRTHLPPRYMTVLQDVVSRLESSALFAEESCSFSQRDLLDNLRIWAAKAARALA
jgi:hypothetical protein